MFTFDFCAATAGLAYSAQRETGGNECKEKESGREGESKRGESIGKPVVRLLLLLVAPQAHTLLILILFHFFPSSFSLFCFVFLKSTREVQYFVFFGLDLLLCGWCGK